ncbi:MAG: hypothetical protein AUJ70_02745 [Candidatus Omnitrophica bacterium CG1_02_40_15]|nr:MAG: hypothetical protein AUJ70_02745 [Candidatus Omnitrophica bacterium CG1_02_40_15]
MTKSKVYQKRFYREWSKDTDLIAQEVIVKETDLFIFAEKDIKNIAEDIVKRYRKEIEDYIKKRPEFMTSLEPIRNDPMASDIIKEMIRTTGLAGVGPMASVAGAIDDFLGNDLLSYSKQVIIENGGDIFIKSGKVRTVAIYAGDSPLSNKIFIKIKPEDTPLGICTSSGTVGHSLSFGKADACVIIAKSATLADAVATATCNRIKEKKDIAPSLEFALSIKGVKAAVVILGKELGSIGDIELT